MSSSAVPAESSPADDVDLFANVAQFVKTVLRPVASIRFTVLLFSLSILLILIGTLAQVQHDIWEVMREYFLTWFAYVPLQVLFPRSWFPNWQNVPGGFPFPGGALIGLGLVVNLASAYVVRFPIQARGLRLASGLGVTAVGLLVTWAIVAGGHNQAGLQGKPPFSWQTLWQIIVFGLVIAAMASWAGVGLAASRVAQAGLNRRRTIELSILGTLAATLSSLDFWLLRSGFVLSDSSMRILWQLIQGTAAGIVLLGGCWLLFKKRAGIVLMHGGIGLLMLGQYLVAKYDKEEQISLEEGQTANYAQDIRMTELAIVDRSPTRSAEDHDDVFAVPRSMLLESELRTQVDAKRRSLPWAYRLGRMLGLARSSPRVARDGQVVHPELPFDFRVVDYFPNHELRDPKKDEENPATQGTGLKHIAEPVREASGTDSDKGVDLAAAYVRFTAKDGRNLGTYLLSQLASAQDVYEKVRVPGAGGEKTYDVALRFQRTYKPYSLTLLDVRKDDYLGTNTPRNYSSDLWLTAASLKEDRVTKVWMNNPLRFAGETFYQSGYNKTGEGKELTTLSVVRNSGWMIPYVACMIVSVGMLAHFLIVLMRFLDRQAQERRTTSELSGFDLACIWGTVALAALWIGSKAREKSPRDGMDLASFGRLPLIYEGRVKPFDTLARNSLRVISTRDTFKDADGRTQPAIRWLLDVIADPEKADDHRVFRIDNLELLTTLKLERHPRHVYSVNELREHIDELERQVAAAREVKDEQRSVYQLKVLELDRRIRMYLRISTAMRPPRMPELPSPEEFRANREAATERIRAFHDAFLAFRRALKSESVPLSVPVAEPEEGSDESWQTYAEAWINAFIETRMLGQKLDEKEPLGRLNQIILAYSENDAPMFNQAVKKYAESLLDRPPEQLSAEAVFGSGLRANVNRFVESRFGAFYRFESWFNHAAPFYYSMVLYVLAFVLACCAWLGWRTRLNWSAFALIAFTLVVHTGALLARMYISGRPPVTNLYSSAVFIGWGAVLLAMVLELLFRNGLGNIVAGVSGFSSLFIAHNLAGDGDTFTVLQAVLDTQFWLATHVVSITLGYSTTFLAGGLGVLYVLRGLLLPSAMQGIATGSATVSGNSDLGLSGWLNRWQANNDPAPACKELTRMIYGTLCFAIFFSFVGTVLGGLWADDSWGRFWGWDPKENGALIIVLWNALVLHSRWSGMVRDRGLALLAIGGNIVTSWSWFGVNELGVGLHSYGFTEGVLRTLALFVGSQLALIGVGLTPLRMWALAGKGQTVRG